MTILIHFHQTGSRCFETYYQAYVLKHLKQEFPFTRADVITLQQVAAVSSSRYGPDKPAAQPLCVKQSS